MTTDDITRNINSRLGISTLNDMQQAMARTTAKAVILTAPTGSGKTLAFAIAMLRALRSDAKAKPQALVLAPSRELVLQIAEVVRPIATDLKTVALYGGHSFLDETRSLSPMPDIIIATPGRLLDHMQRGTLTIDGLRCLVLDEYDKSLELGFESEMRRILRRTGRVDKVILTSATRMATLPDFVNIDTPELLDFTSDEAPENPVDIIEVKSYTPDKLDTLTGLLSTFPTGDRTIIFVNHRESAERVYRHLRKLGYPAGLYHGALDQQQRATAVDMLANGTTPILVATDLAARGLDISKLRNVVHYHLPVDDKAWTHRNGRTGRQNADGTVWVITSDSDNRPEYIAPTRSFVPPIATGRPEPSATATLYIQAGKKDKISKGDVAGFIAAAGAARSDIGLINVYDHHSLAAVPASEAEAIAATASSLKLKGKKTRVSVMHP
ncbi:MAG: DEAD/DEAH box helicase [Paramuribaculum sp.]|nr:DEAD/DEAH box helicase [Paramuribaculum sp.]